jgi:hypothetical protein
MKLIKIPKPEKDGDFWTYLIGDKTRIIIYKTTCYGGRKIKPADRWSIEVYGDVYISACLPTRRACIDAIPRLLRALP